MTFKNDYTEFGGGKLIENSVKTCPSCAALLNFYKKVRLENEKFRDAKKEMLDLIETNY